MSESKPPFSFGPVLRELAADKARAREEAAAAVARTPDAARGLVVRQTRKPPTSEHRYGEVLVDIEALIDAGAVTLLAGAKHAGLDVLPSVLPFARSRGLVVEYRRDDTLLQRFDPDLPLMVRPTQPLEDALAALARAGYRVSRHDGAITIEKEVRRSVALAWVLTISFLPLALAWWAYVLCRGGLEFFRHALVDSYVPGVVARKRLEVAPGRLITGETLRDASRLVAIVRYADIPGEWVYVGVVERDGVASLGDGASSTRRARRLAIEHAALADLLAHVLADGTEAPYR